MENKYYYQMTRRIGNKSARNVSCTLMLDLFLLVMFIMVPAGIVKALEPCFTYQGKNTRTSED